MQGGRGSGRASRGGVRLWGRHAVEAALLNPDRQHRKLWATREGIDSLEGDLPPDFPVEYAQPADLARLVARDAPHQGLVLDCEPLPELHLGDVLDGDPARPLIVLDQVTDPHNAGAILRSAVAMKAGAVITTSRHSPAETGVLAKSASGALDLVNHIQVRNLAEALEELKGLGYQTIGLDSEGPDILENSITGTKVALVMGSEGKGLRQKTRETCDTLARIDMPGEIKSLNVSNAAVLGLYIVNRHLKRF